MLPAEGREVSQQMVGHVLGLAQDRDRALQIPRVPNLGAHAVDPGGCSPGLTH